MLGFIKKDLFMIKGNFKYVLLCLVIFILISLNDNSNFLFIPTFISVMVMISTFSYDEYNKTDAFICSLPNGRVNALKAKYITTILIAFFSAVFTILICFIAGLIQENLDIITIMEEMMGCLLGVILMQAVMYPIIYKWGVEKSRILLFAGVFFITFLITFIASKIGSIDISLIQFLDKYWMIIFTVVILGCLYLSYKISKKIYLNKEF